MTDADQRSERDHAGDGDRVDGDRVVADDGLLVDAGEVVDDGMGADAPADVAGEDEPVDSDESNPLEDATSS